METFRDLLPPPISFLNQLSIIGAQSTTSAMLPDEVWTKILSDWVQDAVDWAQFSQACRHFYYGLPRPRPVQLVARDMRYPHVLFLEKIAQEGKEDDTTQERIELFCYNATKQDDERPLLNTLATEDQAWRIFTYIQGDKAYLEPSYYSSRISCETDGARTREVEGYGLAFLYPVATIHAAYKTIYPAGSACYWKVQKRYPDKPWIDIRYGTQESSMSLDFDSFFKAFLLIDGDIWTDCTMEDYRVDLPVYLTNHPPFWKEKWRRRLYQALPCQPTPFIRHAYQTNVYAPESWDGVDYEEDAVEDYILTGNRTAVVTFTMELRDSHIIIQSPAQIFALRLPILQDDLDLFSSGDPGAWLRHLYDRQSRRWFLARKYFRLAADVQETQRSTTAADVVGQWPLMHPNYVYTVDEHDDFLLTLPNSQVALTTETEELLQQATDEGLSYRKAWCVVLHG